MIKIPSRVKVASVISARYSPEECDDAIGLSRPASWDRRYSGTEKILTTCGKELLLWSGGGQSTPQPNSEILLTQGDAQQGYHWTLYGFAKKSN